jgi:hypothetical protein
MVTGAQTTAQRLLAERKFPLTPERALLIALIGCLVDRRQTVANLILRRKPPMGLIVDIVAAALCVIGGIYLLTSNTVAADSYLDVIAHGMGLYFIGRGIFSFRDAEKQTDARDLLMRIAGVRKGDPR